MMCNQTPSSPAIDVDTIIHVDTVQLSTRNVIIAATPVISPLYAGSPVVPEAQSQCHSDAEEDPQGQPQGQGEGHPADPQAGH